ncbi:MAG: hypothetical protein MI723_15740 [Caulobacterales bacterium]|nr:hypothetical protein [Caulobacterales bacterium]
MHLAKQHANNRKVVIPRDATRRSADARPAAGLDAGDKALSTARRENAVAAAAIAARLR